MVSEESRGVPGDLAMETGELPPIQRDPSKPLKRPRLRPIRLTIKVVLFVAALYIFVLPLIPGFRSAVHEITRVEPMFLVIGLALQVAAWFAYALLTRSALGESGARISRTSTHASRLRTKATSTAPISACSDVTSSARNSSTTCGGAPSASPPTITPGRPSSSNACPVP